MTLRIHPKKPGTPPQSAAFDKEQHGPPGAQPGKPEGIGMKSKTDRTNHDQNFKNLILDYPHEALSFFAAEEARCIEAEARITPIRL